MAHQYTTSNASGCVHSMPHVPSDKEARGFRYSESPTKVASCRSLAFKDVVPILVNTFVSLLRGAERHPHNYLQQVCVCVRRYTCRYCVLVHGASSRVYVEAQERQDGGTHGTSEM